MMEVENHKDELEDEELPKTKIDLLRKIGSSGPYQTKLIIIFSAIWGTCAILSMSIVFFFFPRDFNCPQNGFITDSCSDAVCQLPKPEWIQFVDKSQDYFKTIATELGKNNLCGDLFYNDLVVTMGFIGNLCGFLVVSSFSDNYGRLKVLSLSWIITVSGAILLVFSQNLWMVGASLFIISSGSNSSFNISFAYVSETFEHKNIEKCLIIFQCMFPIISMIMTTQFLFIKSWILIAVVSILIPSTLILAMIFLFVKETPEFLLRQGVVKALEQLNKIGKINKGKDNVLQQKDILSVIQNDHKVSGGDISGDKSYQFKYTFIDLFRFPSLRRKVIPLSIMGFGMMSMYYGLSFLIDEFGFNLYLASYVLSLSQLLTYYPLYLYISKIPRKTAGVVSFGCIGICSTALLFIEKKDCIFCFSTILRIFFIGVFKIAASAELTLIGIYNNQLYPNKIKATATGFTLSVGSLSVILWPITVGYFKRNGIDANILYTILAYIAVAMSLLLDETLGQQMQDDIQNCRNENSLITEGINEQRSQQQANQASPGIQQ